MPFDNRRGVPLLFGKGSLPNFGSHPTVGWASSGATKARSASLNGCRKPTWPRPVR